MGGAALLLHEKIQNDKMKNIFILTLFSMFSFGCNIKTTYVYPYTKEYCDSLNKIEAAVHVVHNGYTVSWRLVTRTSRTVVKFNHDKYGRATVLFPHTDTIISISEMYWRCFKNKDSALKFISEGKKDSTRMLGVESVENMNLQSND